MYRLPASLDPSGLVGEELQQVCIGVSDLILKFEQPLSILVTSSVAITSALGEQRNFENLVDAGRSILDFLGATVTSAVAMEGRTLRLHFGARGTLDIFDDSDHYESYVIQRGDKITVV
jgi:hypothetical protein